jgi:hypothetical protein
VLINPARNPSMFRRRFPIGCGTQANTYSDGTRPQGASWDSGEGSPELLSVNGPINKGLMSVRA